MLGYLVSGLAFLYNLLSWGFVILLSVYFGCFGRVSIRPFGPFATLGLYLIVFGISLSPIPLIFFIISSIIFLFLWNTIYNLTLKVAFFGVNIFCLFTILYMFYLFYHGITKDLFVCIFVSILQYVVISDKTKKRFLVVTTSFVGAFALSHIYFRHWFFGLTMLAFIFFQLSVNSRQLPPINWAREASTGLRKLSHATRMLFTLIYRRIYRTLAYFTYHITTRVKAAINVVVALIRLFSYFLLPVLLLSVMYRGGAILKSSVGDLSIIFASLWSLHIIFLEYHSNNADLLAEFSVYPAAICVITLLYLCWRISPSTPELAVVLILVLFTVGRLIKKQHPNPSGTSFAKVLYDIKLNLAIIFIADSAYNYIKPFKQLVSPCTAATVPKIVQVEEREEDLCVICETNETDTVIWDCGHLIGCTDCISRLPQQLCPICRVTITETKKIFRA